jgi:t-SNARE complex subunit (syntaxin)
MSFAKSPVDELRDVARKATEVTRLVEEAKKGVVKTLEEAKEQAKKLSKVVDWLKALWEKVRPWLIMLAIVCCLVMLWPLFTLLSTVRAALGGVVYMFGLSAPPAT